MIDRPQETETMESEAVDKKESCISFLVSEACWWKIKFLQCGPKSSHLFALCF